MKLLILSFLLSFGGANLAGEAAPPVPGNGPNRAPGVGAPPPLPPASKSPVTLFRELLTMELGERQQFFEKRPPETQKRLLEKVREYELMPADERELRLQATELRWYLRPLMSVPPKERSAPLEAIPETFRSLVKDRLRIWDILPPPLQRELLENEATIYFFTELNAVTEAQRQAMLARIPEAERERLENGIRNWNSMPEDRRRDIVLRFNQFFELNDREKSKAMATLSPPERDQLQRTLKRFESLPPRQRAQCIRSFEKFASLTLPERQQFLKNAEHWNAMSPQERQSWRQLVATLSLMPSIPPRLPPMPIRPSPTTNGG